MVTAKSLPSSVLLPIYRPGIQTKGQVLALQNLGEWWKRFNPDIYGDNVIVLASSSSDDNAAFYDYRKHFGNGYIYPKDGEATPPRWVLQQLESYQGDSASRAPKKPIFDTYSELKNYAYYIRYYLKKSGIVVATAPHVTGINIMLGGMQDEDMRDNVTVLSFEGILAHTNPVLYRDLINSADYQELTEKFYSGERLKNIFRVCGGNPTMEALSRAASKAPKVKKVAHSRLHR